MKVDEQSSPFPLMGRGFLVPELAKATSFTKLSLISGVIWAAWHSPILLFADYNAGTNRWYALACFSVMVVSISFVFAWMRLKSGSLWTGAILHASHNLFVQGVFDQLMRDTWQATGYDLLPKLRNLSIPTLVISGDHDFIPGEIAVHIARAVDLSLNMSCRIESS